MMKKMLFVNLALLSLSVLAEPAQLKLVGDFDVEVAYNGKKGVGHIFIMARRIIDEMIISQSI